MTGSQPQPFVLSDGTSGVHVLPAEPSDGAPLVVHLHGGGGSCREAVQERFSLLGALAEGGTPAFALNRPGYPGGAPLSFPATSDDGSFAASADLLIAAIDELWERFGAGSSGVVLLGCSVGSAIALTIGARKDVVTPAGWPLRGIAVADVGHVPEAGVPELWASTPVVDVIEDMGPIVQRLDFGPRWCRLSTPGDGETLKIARSEVLEIQQGWVRSALDIARSITVPVLWRLSEFDPIWSGVASAEAEFVAALRVSSPYVDGRVLPGASHPIQDGQLARHLALSVLAFAELCGRNARTPQILDVTAR
ncbi:MAG: alpha/beta fold hydrolase [Microbacterium sp.]